jgi:hypothetical protein
VNNKAVIYAVVGIFIAFRIYQRMRRSIGRQPLRPGRITFRLVLICLFTFAISAFLISQSPLALAGFGGGLLGGVLLGFVGLRLTKFETTSEGHFYIPDTRMGVGISSIVAIRILYRYAVPPDFSLVPGHTAPPISPLTFFLIGISFGYFIVYLIGLLVHTHDKNKQLNEPPNVLPPENPV